MNRLRNLLLDADPLRHDPPRRDDDRERVRQTMLRSLTDDRSATPARARLLFLAAAAMVVIAVSVLGYQLWTRGSTPVFAALRFEVRLAEDHPTPGLVVAQIGNSGRLIYLHPEIVVNNDDIAQAWMFQEDAARFGVAVKFLPSGAERMLQATTAHLNRPMAILIDGEVVMAPTIRAPISDSATINGVFSQAQAQRVADGIGRP
jgi:hypothetical protein